MEIEISKNSIKLLTYLDKFQRFSIPYEELIKPNELKNLLDYLVGKNKTFNQMIFNDILERIEEKGKILTIKEFVKTLLEAEYFIELKLKKIENIRLHYKRLFNRIDENIIYLQDYQKKVEKSDQENDNFFIIEIENGENFERLRNAQTTELKSVAYVIMRYCDMLKETLAQKTINPIWSEKFRFPLKTLQENILLEVILNEERTIQLSQYGNNEDLFDSYLYLFNLNFQKDSDLLIDLYHSGNLVGAQIRISVQFRWYNFQEPIYELKMIKERLTNQYNYLIEDKDLYITQLRCLLEPFDENNSRQFDFTYHNLISSNLIDETKRKNKNIFLCADKNSKIIEDRLIYSGLNKSRYAHMDDNVKLNTSHQGIIEESFEREYIDPDKYLGKPETRHTNVSSKPFQHEEYAPSISVSEYNENPKKNQSPQKYTNKLETKKLNNSFGQIQHNEYAPSMNNLSEYNENPKNQSPQKYTNKLETKKQNTSFGQLNHEEYTPSMNNVSEYNDNPPKNQSPQKYMNKLATKKQNTSFGQFNHNEYVPSMNNVSEYNENPQKYQSPQKYSSKLDTKKENTSFRQIQHEEYSPSNNISETNIIPKNQSPQNYTGRLSNKKNSSFLKPQTNREDYDPSLNLSDMNYNHSKEPSTYSKNELPNFPQKNSSKNENLKNSFKNIQPSPIKTEKKPNLTNKNSPILNSSYQYLSPQKSPNNESLKKSPNNNKDDSMFRSPNKYQLNSSNDSPELNQDEVLDKKNKHNQANNTSMNMTERKSYHQKPSTKLESPEKLSHKPLVINENFPHYVHPDIAANKKYKQKQKK